MSDEGRRDSANRSSDPSPLVSVVVPTYDRPAHVVEAVQSAVDQTYRPLEVLVVDDHSPTPVATVLEDGAIERSSVAVIRHDENRGANAARNTGLEAATGDYLAFLDDDDRWLEDKLDRQVRRARSTGSGLVTCGQRTVDDRGRTTHRKRPSLEGRVTRALLEGAEIGTFSDVLVSRGAVETVGLPDEALPVWQDRDWFIRLSTATPVSSVDAVLTIRRVGAHGQLTDEYLARRDVAFPRLLAKHAPLARSLGCERAFEATMTAKLAASAIATGHYGETVEHALRAIRLDPTRRAPYIFLCLAVGGDLLYRPASRVRRALAGVTRDENTGRP